MIVNQLLLIFCCSLLIKASGIIKWNGNWAMHCDFKGNDFLEVRMRGDLCGNKCSDNPRCTHFTWAYGVCYLKSGRVHKINAVFSHDMVCGIIRSSSDAWGVSSSSCQQPSKIRVPSSPQMLLRISEDMNELPHDLLSVLTSRIGYSSGYSDMQYCSRWLQIADGLRLNYDISGFSKPDALKLAWDALISALKTFDEPYEANPNRNKEDRYEYMLDDVLPGRRPIKSPVRFYPAVKADIRVKIPSTVRISFMVPTDSENSAISGILTVIIDYKRKTNDYNFCQSKEKTIQSAITSLIPVVGSYINLSINVLCGALAYAS